MHSKTPVHTHCQNCGAELKGPYCHACGQHDFEVHQSFLHLVHELLESFFHFEGKFFKGTFDLLFRPGALTTEFNAGKRASQMPPLRLYIFISLIFFLAPDVGPQGSDINVNTSKGAATALSSPSSQEHQPRAQAPNARKTEIIFETGSRWDSVLQEKLQHLDVIQDHFLAYLPKMLMACVPLFALLSLLTFRKAGLNYLQHVIFSLHLHSFFMLFRLVSTGWVLLANLLSPTLGSVVVVGCLLYFPLYAYLALRKVFGHQRRGTLLRGTLLLGAYGLVLLAGFAVTGLLALLLS